MRKNQIIYFERNNKHKLFWLQRWNYKVFSTKIEPLLKSLLTRNIYIYIYIYLTEISGAPTIFHVTTIFFFNFFYLGFISYIFIISL